MRAVIADLDRAAATSTALAEQVEKEFGHLDVLINNAGIFDLAGWTVRQATCPARL